MMRPSPMWLGAVTILVAGACHRGVRCATCGMKVDPESPWVSYVTLGQREVAFDTPHCAFTAWRRDARSGSAARFREYYSQEMKPADDVHFVTGSDVVGPMGPDLVPVAAEAAARFARDHNGAPPKSARQIIEERVP
jgi:copper chaperone NosL